MNTTTTATTVATSEMINGVISAYGWSCKDSNIDKTFNLYSSNGNTINLRITNKRGRFQIYYTSVECGDCLLMSSNSIESGLINLLENYWYCEKK